MKKKEKPHDIVICDSNFLIWYNYNLYEYSRCVSYSYSTSPKKKKMFWRHVKPWSILNIFYSQKDINKKEE